MDANRVNPLLGLLIEPCGILYECQDWLRWTWLYAQRFGCAKDLQSFSAAWRDAVLPELCFDRASGQRAMESFLAGYGLTAGQANELATAAFAQRKAARAAMRPIAGACSALMQLQSLGVKLVLIADSEDDESVWQCRMKRWNWLGLEIKIITPAESGYAKPHQESFHSAAAAAGLAPTELGFLGMYFSDLAAAASLGLTTISLQMLPNKFADYRLENIRQVTSIFRIPHWIAAA